MWVGFVVGGVAVLGIAAVAGMVAFGTSDPPPYLASIGEPFRKVDVPRTLALLADWCGDADAWRRILVDNPARLYGFS